MANTAFNTSGLVLSSPAVAASVTIDITSYYDEVVTSFNISSSLITISGGGEKNGTSIVLYTSSISPSNTDSIVYVQIADGDSLVTTLTNTTTAFNASASIYPFWGATNPFGTLSATDDGVSVLTISAPLNDPNGNSYTLDGNRFSGGVINSINNTKLAGFTVIADSTVVSNFIDYEGNQLADTTNWTLSIGTTIPLYCTSLSLGSGTIVAYPISTIIPQI
jgi:hypothetical protein